jgi:predicted nucleic-acid-binding protein
MRIVDTVVLIAFLDQNDSRFVKANEYVMDIGMRQDILVPSATLLELDLEFKAHGISAQRRVEIHARFERLIPQSRILPITSTVLGRAAELAGLEVEESLF